MQDPDALASPGGTAPDLPGEEGPLRSQPRDPHGARPSHQETEAPDAAPAARRRRHFWRRIPIPVRMLISVASIVLIVVFLLLPKLDKSSRNIHRLIHLNVGYLLIGVGLEIFSLVAYARLTESVLPGKRLSFSTLLRIDMSTLAVSHLLPGGTAAGTVLGYRLLGDRGVSNTDATFALGAQGIGSAVVLNVMLWLALIVAIPLHGFNSIYKTVAIVGVLLLGGFGFLVFLLTHGQDRAARSIHWIASKLPFVDPDLLERVLRELADHLRELASDRKLLTRAIVWAVANWALDAASLWVFLFAFGNTVLPPYLLVAYGLAYVLAAIPITPAGLGVVEGVLTAVLVGFGYSNAALGVLSYRVVNFLLPIPVGGLAYLSLTVDRARQDNVSRSRRLREVASTARHEAESIDHWAERYGVAPRIGRGRTGGPAHPSRNVGGKAPPVDR